MKEIREPNGLADVGFGYTLEPSKDSQASEITNVVLLATLWPYTTLAALVRLQQETPIAGRICPSPGIYDSKIPALRAPPAPQDQTCSA